jgi:hypothetical protein
MTIHNQIIICGKKHTSIATLNRYYCNAQLVAAIGIHKGNHYFHRGINTHLFATTVSTDATHIFGCHNI